MPALKKIVKTIFVDPTTCDNINEKGECKCYDPEKYRRPIPCNEIAECHVYTQNNKTVGSP